MNSALVVGGAKVKWRWWDNLKQLLEALCKTWMSEIYNYIYVDYNNTITLLAVYRAIDLLCGLQKPQQYYK